MNGKKVLKYSALALFVISVLEMGIYLSLLIMEDVISVASVFDSLFVIEAQNVTFGVISGFAGLAAGYMGLLCSRNEASAINYRYITTGLLIVYLVINAFIFANGIVFPWLGVVIDIIITAGYCYGLFKMTGKI